MSTNTPSWQIGTGGRRAAKPKRPGKLDQIRSSGTLTRFAPAPADAAEVANSLGIVSGYGSVTGVWTQISDRSGSFMESIAPGAFANVDPADVRILYNHGRGLMQGELPIATLDELVEDEAGLRYSGQLFPTLGNLELLPALTAGLLGSSFRFAVTRDAYTPKPGVSSWNPEGLPERTVLEADVMELGPVVWPAYRTATATAVPANSNSMQLSGNSTGSIAASREPRRTTRQSWEFPAARPAKNYAFTKET